MSFSNNAYLPTYDDLYVPPLNLTSPILKAGAIHFGVYCNKQSNDYMLCSNEEKDPRKCLEYNKKLSYCASDFFHKVKDNCADSFTKYWKCLDSDTTGRMAYKSCTKIQVDFDKCMKEKLNIERPPLGDLSRVRLYDPERPKSVDNFKKVNKLEEAPTVADINKYPEAKDSIKRTGRYE